MTNITKYITQYKRLRQPNKGYIVPKMLVEEQLLVLQKLDEVLPCYKTHILTKRVSQKKGYYTHFAE